MNRYVSRLKWHPELVSRLLSLINCGPTNGCQQCCRKPAFVRVLEPEIPRIAEYLRRDENGLRLLWSRDDGYGIPTPCEFSTDHGCSIYSVRPSVCRCFPLHQVTMGDELVIGVATAWCSAGFPCIAQLDEWFEQIVSQQ